MHGIIIFMKFCILKKIVLLALGAVFVYTANAQMLNYSMEVNGTAGGGDYAPFWHSSNRFGLGSTETKNGYVRAALSSSAESKNGKWFFSYGADLVAGYNQTSSVFVQQAYGQVNRSVWQLTIGQKERNGEMKNQRLSTGALTESGNARPLPQVRIEIPEYWDLFGTAGWFTLRGHLAYGIFTDGKWQQNFAAAGTRYAKNVRYHSKALFMHGGNEEKYPLTAVWGLQMAAQFGGTIYNSSNREGNTVNMPSRPKDYFKAFIPLSGDSRNTPSDQANIAGNQMGSWHFELAWKEESWKVRTYFEHYFEDHSGMFLEYGMWKDGLYGFEVEVPAFQWINNVVFEYFNSRDGSGPIYHDSTDKIPDQISCKDGMYDHFEFVGWNTYGRVIGSPLITSPIYNEDGKLKIYNNRVEVFHLGFAGKPRMGLDYRVLLTRMQGWGTYAEPFTHIKSNFSGMVEFSYSPQKWNGWRISLSAAIDRGDLYGDNTGAMFSLRKVGVIRFK